MVAVHLTDMIKAMYRIKFVYFDFLIFTISKAVHETTRKCLKYKKVISKKESCSGIVKSYIKSTYILIRCYF